MEKRGSREKLLLSPDVAFANIFISDSSSFFKTGFKVLQILPSE